MKKQMKILITILMFISIFISGNNVFAKSILNGEIEISQDYLDYLELDDEKKKNAIPPRMYDIYKKSTKITNPFKLGRMLGASIKPKYSLKNIIPENTTIKNQLMTEGCWAFASLASLETYLALQDYKNERETVIYDFSEKHMDYATSNEFLDNKTNEFGFKRKPGSTGVEGIPISYLTNGLGAVAENEMIFDGKTDLIDISEIQNKNVITQVNDIVTFPSYSVIEDTTQIKKQMKEHIMNYGAIRANINGYMNEKGAIYCNNTYMYPINHSVAIIGWDDEYAISNFDEKNSPQNPGAWIAKNSYGTELGEEGYVYISYEDVNVYKQLVGILNAKTERTYENIYQHDELGGYLKYTKKDTSKIYLATEFDKKTNGKEYLTQVAIRSPETYNCKVYVNPNGTSKDKKDLQFVELKSGETETFDAGYHTIEFANPIKVGEKFVVVLEIQGSKPDSVSMLIEVNFGEFYTDPKYENAPNHAYDVVKISDSKCFFGSENEAMNNQWTDASKVYEISQGKLPNFDTTIKAFTTTKVSENIEIVTPPTKTSYMEGEDFDVTGMVIKENWANGEKVDITDYKIKNGTNLVYGQTEVIVEYNGFTAKQPIEVKKEEQIVEKPVNSNLSNIKGNVQRARNYYFSNPNKKEYMVLDIKISDIIKATENENMEYYYYLSSKSNETNITKWTKIEKSDNPKLNDLEFEVNTLNLSNYEELVDAKTIYLYVKEIATRNNLKAEVISNAISIKLENMNIEQYIDGKKKADVNSETITKLEEENETDNTVISGSIPPAGKKAVIIFFIILTAIIVFCKVKLEKISKIC